MSVIPINFDVEEVGKRIKKSKKRYTWRLSLDEKDHTIQLFASYLSGKKKIVHNGDIIFEGKKIINSSFQYPFNIGRNMLNIYQKDEGYELKINNIDFGDLYFKQGSTYLKPVQTNPSSFAGYQIGEIPNQNSDYNKPRSKTTSSSYLPDSKSSWGDVKKATEEARKDAKPIYNVKSTPRDSKDSAFSDFSQFETNNNQQANPYQQQTVKVDFSKTQFSEQVFKSHKNCYSSDFGHSTSKPDPNYMKSKGTSDDKKENTMQFANIEMFQPDESTFTDFSNFGDFKFNPQSSQQPVQKPEPQNNETSQSSESEVPQSSQPQKPQPKVVFTNLFETESDFQTKLYGYDGYDEPVSQSSSSSTNNISTFTSPTTNTNIRASTTTKTGHEDLFNLDFSNNTPQTKKQGDNSWNDFSKMNNSSSSNMANQNTSNNNSSFLNLYQQPQTQQQPQAQPKLQTQTQSFQYNFQSSTQSFSQSNSNQQIQPTQQIQPSQTTQQTQNVTQQKIEEKPDDKKNILKKDLFTLDANEIEASRTPTSKPNNQKYGGMSSNSQQSLNTSFNFLNNTNNISGGNNNNFNNNLGYNQNQNNFSMNNQFSQQNNFTNGFGGFGNMNNNFSNQNNSQNSFNNFGFSNPGMVGNGSNSQKSNIFDF